MHIFRWNLKSVDEIRCSLLLNSKKWNITRPKKNFPGATKKKFFRKLRSQNFFFQNLLFKSNINLQKFHLGPMLRSWDKAYPKILDKTLVAAFVNKTSTLINISEWVIFLFFSHIHAAKIYRSAFLSCCCNHLCLNTRMIFVCHDVSEKKIACTHRNIGKQAGHCVDRHRLSKSLCVRICFTSVSCCVKMR